ncbi:CRTAC1 family protein [Candidatus Poribacteria bacterium]|jgi:enediyne biosynthesis protein E4|nr:CRTAC1 family protein [Candidatus Poribacteria bacterium]MBT5533123.1 CRTAC1 family protein [Candidatus Poribacteria bacterium]MBT5711577.1 CRTAC1 family protein [Candidatus Poribacteria bacterium]MBT7100094.1 CRTAC1 family protein [Candidatus Poribacteria bacterium]MBT7806434.1 CRTAC1 family protein [Candidatus Poribacteria bacterium]
MEELPQLLAARRLRYILPICCALLQAFVSCGGPSAPPPDPPVPLRFTEVALDVGLDFTGHQGDGLLDYIPETTGSGAAWLDYDDDDDWDLYVLDGPGHRNVLYRNDGGRFTDVTEEAGVGHLGDAMGVAIADYDGDGRTDIFFTTFDSPDVLYRNRGDGAFEDVTETAGVGGLPEEWGTSAAWGDTDGDGDLDLYVARYIDFTDPGSTEEIYPAERTADLITLVPDPYPAQSNALYRNNGDGTFTDIAASARAEDSAGKGLGVGIVDYDNDGDLDIYIANDVTPNSLLKNRGDGTFEDAGFLTGTNDQRQGMGVDFGDADGDGDLDLLVTNWQNEMNAYYRNNRLARDGFQTSDSFDDMSTDAGLGDTSVGLTGWGAAFEDFDNDGDLDLYVTNGHTSPSEDDPGVCEGQRDQVYRNDGPRFVEMVDAVRVGKWGAGRGVATADYDGDGDVDVLVTQNNGRMLLFRNDVGQGRDWVKVRAPVGTRLTVTSRGATRERAFPGGTSYLCARAPEIVVGLGSDAPTSRVEVTLPGSSRALTLPALEPRSTVTYVWGSEHPRILPRY